MAMIKRQAYHPEAVDGLEKRQLLSHSGVLGAATPAAAVHATATSSPLGGVGTLGDSFTDEYRFYPFARTQARNWVETLATTRNVDFGPFTTKSRGEPRNAGYAYNWARSDATTHDMLRNQLPNLLPQVAKGQVKNVVILIGGNDFLLPLEGVVEGNIRAALYAAALPMTTAQAGANLQSAVDRLLAANRNVHLVLTTIDISDLPIVRGVEVASPAIRPLVQAVNQSVGLYNQAIRGLAATSPRIALVDLAATNQQLGQLNVPSIPFGGTTIQLTQVGEDYHDFFLDDNVHPGTVAQGIIADLFVEALDVYFGGSITPLSDAEIVHHAANVQSKIRHGVSVP
jgi:phospholipase/lecithinase/hemolysin